ncbi:MAG: hypothetical protein IJV15_05610 [Lachnospiraceae bacterium]|nr:hypothetical protein [Lachnospiraceae bacterium]
MIEIWLYVLRYLAMFFLAFTIMLPYVFHVLKNRAITGKGEQRDNLIWGHNRKRISNIRVVFDKVLDAPIRYEMPEEYTVSQYGDNYPTPKDKERERVYVDIIDSAEDYVHIMTPFLQVGDEMENALLNAVKRGVDIKLILAGSGNQKSAFTITEHQIKILISFGVEIYEYRNGIIYANICTSDNDKAVVDFANRGLYHQMPGREEKRRNGSIAEIEGDFERTLKKCVRL